MKKSKLSVALLTACMAATLLAGCGDKKTETTEATVADATASEAEDDENYETGDASLDNVRNQDEIGDNELLVVSFGTSFNDSRRLTIGAIEDKLDEEFGKDYKPDHH